MRINKYLLQFIGFILVFLLDFAIMGIIYKFIPMTLLEIRTATFLLFILLSMIFWAWYMNLPDVRKNEQ